MATRTGTTRPALSKNGAIRRLIGATTSLAAGRKYTR
nr:MAG TPA: hypothetical protein [Caudoviricetes sp.]